MIIKNFTRKDKKGYWLYDKLICTGVESESERGSTVEQERKKNKYFLINLRTFFSFFLILKLKNFVERIRYLYESQKHTW